MNLLRRIERKIIKSNTLFIREGEPRIPKIDKEINLTIKGSDSINIFKNNDIFSGFDSTDSVLIKININSSNPYPASTSSKMLEAIIVSLKAMGIKKIEVADSSGLSHLPTRKVFKEKKFNFFNEYGVKFKSLDYGPWLKIPINGRFFKEIVLHKLIFSFNKIINLSNIKSHSRSDFTLSTKLLVGFMHPGQRIVLHKDHLKERIAEITLAIKPDLNIIDGRKIFYDGGPDLGKVSEPGIIIVGTDLLKTDLLAYKILVEQKKKHDLFDLEEDPYQNTFFKHFLKINNNYK